MLLVIKFGEFLIYLWTSYMEAPFEILFTIFFPVLLIPYQGLYLGADQRGTEIVTM